LPLSEYPLEIRWRDSGAILARFVIQYSCMYKPRFTITPQVNLKIAEIERLRALVDTSNILPTKEVVLRKRASIEATRSSTGIEGNPLNEHEVELILSGKKVSASDRFITEVVNYKKALQFIGKMARYERFSVKNILDLHAICMYDLLPAAKTGTFRKTPIYVVNIIGWKQIVRYTGPEPKIVPKLVDDLLAWLNEQKGNLHPILAAAILHFEFVSIHPFADGNGRVTRLLTLLYLFQHGYAFRNVLVPDTYYFEDRPRYYNALNQARQYDLQRKMDITPWVEYFVDGIAVAVKDITEKITRVSVTRARGEVVTLTGDDYQIIDLVSMLKKAAVDDIIFAVKIPKRTIQRRLQYLVDNGLLLRKGKGRATRYVLKVK